MDLSNKVAEILRSRSGERFAARELGELLFEVYPDECAEKKARSEVLKTDEDVIKQLAAEIASSRYQIQKRYPAVRTNEVRPRQYYYSQQDAVVADAEYSEKDLYDSLHSFLWSEFKLYSMRIDEKRSSNKAGKEGNVWLHPDLVAVEDLSKDWNSGIKEIAGLHYDKKITMWSFEVKLNITRSSVRKDFFQTVSNSFWANYAYLVAGEVTDSDTMDELRILSSLYGIGVISLNHSSPAESQITIPAKAKDSVDWNIASRLAEENSDFAHYIKLIKQFYQTGEFKPSEWGISADD